MTSNNIPDHNTCSGEIDERNNRASFPARPMKRAGDVNSFPTTNAGTIGYALNGVQIFGGHDSDCCDAGLFEFVTLGTALKITDFPFIIIRGGRHLIWPTKCKRRLVVNSVPFLYRSLIIDKL